MSVTGAKGVGIPIILLHDAEGSVVTIELKDGSMYCGTLDDAQDNMNCLMKSVTRTGIDGTESKLEMAYVRGSQINFIVLPDTLKYAPFFNRIKNWRKTNGHPVLGSASSGAARGSAAAILQKSTQRRAQVEQKAGTGRGTGGAGAGAGPGSQQPMYGAAQMGMGMGMGVSVGMGYHHPHQPPYQGGGGFSQGPPYGR
jgi:small nuclear ribonucleoprotein D3